MLPSRRNVDRVQATLPHPREIKSQSGLRDLLRRHVGPLLLVPALSPDKSSRSKKTSTSPFSLADLHSGCSASVSHPFVSFLSPFFPPPLSPSIPFLFIPAVLILSHLYAPHQSDAVSRQFRFSVPEIPTPGIGAKKDRKPHNQDLSSRSFNLFLRSSSFQRHRFNSAVACWTRGLSI
jgi:hypothetical protein